MTRLMTLEELNEILAGGNGRGAVASNGAGTSAHITDGEGLERRMGELGFVRCGFCSGRANTEYGIQNVWHRATAEACAATGLGGEEGVQ